MQACAFCWGVFGLGAGFLTVAPVPHFTHGWLFALLSTIRGNGESDCSSRIHLRVLHSEAADLLGAPPLPANGPSELLPSLLKGVLSVRRPTIGPGVS